jgi:predicted GIY-YIG superfamily endonuclease
MSYYCYLLRNGNCTYNGYTVAPKRRLRQHNGEIKGGAKYTSSKGDGWEMYFLMTGFPNPNNAMSFEWRLRHPDNKRKRPTKYSGPKGRINGLADIIGLENWTNQTSINNSEQQFKIWITEDMKGILKDIPNNIEINIVDKINFDQIG